MDRGFENANFEGSAEMTTERGRRDWPGVVQKLREKDWDQEGVILTGR
ncbi:MAG: hypothetical protein ACJA2W_002070 [Planctomycetota bacterium]|jgi:hypothetical protein